jgi:alkylhydroperoxidase family enzyme
VVEAALVDPESASLRPVVRAALALTKQLALDPDAVGGAQIQPLRDAGADDDSIEDVILIAAAFATINRIADALDFALLTREQYDSGAKLMYKHGYDLI